MEKRLKNSYTEDYKNISLHPPFLNFETMGFKGVLNRLKPWNYPLGHLSLLLWLEKRLRV